jgi:hypothetical protein
MPSRDLSAFGLDTSNDRVWAVLDHNSVFASGAIPEPMTLSMLALGGLLIAGRRPTAQGATQRGKQRPRG